MELLFWRFEVRGFFRRCHTLKPPADCHIADLVVLFLFLIFEGANQVMITYILGAFRCCLSIGCLDAPVLADSDGYDIFVDAGVV